MVLAETPIVLIEQQHLLAADQEPTVVHLAIAGLNTEHQDLQEVLHLLITEAQEPIHQHTKDLLPLADQALILHLHVLHLPIVLQGAQEDHREV